MNKGLDAFANQTHAVIGFIHPTSQFESQQARVSDRLSALKNPAPACPETGMLYHDNINR